VENFNWLVFILVFTKGFYIIFIHFDDILFIFICILQDKSENIYLFWLDILHFLGNILNCILHYIQNTYIVDVFFLVFAR